MPTSWKRSAKKRAAVINPRPKQSLPSPPPAGPTREEMDMLDRAFETMNRVKDEVLKGKRPLEDAEAAIREYHVTGVSIFGKLNPSHFPPDHIERAVAEEMKWFRNLYDGKKRAPARKAVSAERAKANQEKERAKLAEREAKASARARESEAKRKAETLEREAFKRLKDAEAQALRGKLPLDKLEEAARSALKLRLDSGKRKSLLKTPLSGKLVKLRFEVARHRMQEARERVINGTLTIDEAVADCVKFQMSLAEINGRPIDEAQARKRAAADINHLQRIATEIAQRREESEEARQSPAATADDERLRASEQAVAQMRLAAAEAEKLVAEQRLKVSVARGKYEGVWGEAMKVLSSGKERQNVLLAESLLRAVDEAECELEEATQEFELHNQVATLVGGVRQRLLRAEVQKLDQEHNRKEQERRKLEEARIARERKLRAEREREERKARAAREREERKIRAAKEREEMKLRVEQERQERLRREAELKRRQEKAKAAAESYLRGEVKKLKAEGKGEACGYHLIARPFSDPNARPTAALVKVCINSGGRLSRAQLGGNHPLTNAVTSMWSLLEVEPSAATRKALEALSSRLSSYKHQPNRSLADSFYEALSSTASPGPDSSLRSVNNHIDSLLNTLYTVGKGMSGTEASRVARELAQEVGEMTRAFDRPTLPSALLD